MASRGTHIGGTDGTDYRHRQRVVSSHSASAEAKRYLTATFYIHFPLWCIIAVKIAIEVFDRANVFILSLQELNLPQPDLWEWLYVWSFQTSILATRAMHLNSARWIALYQVAHWCLSIVPLVLGEVKYLPEFISFIISPGETELRYTWYELPLAVLFQAFAFVALQIHIVQLYFSIKLYRIWSSYGKTQSAGQTTKRAAKKID